MPLDVLLGGEPLVPPITGIGRYTEAIAKGLLRHPTIGAVTCYLNGAVVDAESALPIATRGVGDRLHARLAHVLKNITVSYEVSGAVRRWHFRKALRQIQRSEVVYHEPNYILGPYEGPTVVNVHDLSTLRYPNCHPRGRVRYLERWLPKTLARADRVVTASELIRDELEEVLGVRSDRVNVVPLGVDARFRPYKTSEIQANLRELGIEPGRYLLSVCTLEPRKNLCALVASYARLPKTLRREFPLVLVGLRGWGFRDLEKMVEPLKHRGEIRRLGYVPDALLAAVYAGARAFAYPSLYEGFGLPVLEAMASGVPVLTSQRTAMAEFAEGSVLLVNPLSLEEIGDGLQRILLDDRLRENAVKAGIATADMLSWARCVEATVRVYQQARSRQTVG